METMIGRLLNTWRVIRTVFKQGGSAFVTGCLFLTLWWNTTIGLLLDPIFFPRLRRTEIKAPIVIVGNPRTGTTFLQRFLTDQGLGAGMQLWRMIYPSLLLQVVLKPFLPLLEKLSPAKHHAAAAHKTGLLHIETDDPSTLFRYFDGFFLYGFFMSWDEKDWMQSFDPEVRDTSDRDFRWFREMWRRSLVHTGRDRIVAKVFSLGLRTPRFLQSFPDAKILYMVRDPVAVVPSGLSLVTGVLDAKFGFWKQPEELRRRYIERLYTAFLVLCTRFHDDWQSGKINRDNVYIVRYDRMMSDFEGVMSEILPFAGIEATPALQAEISKVAAKQRAWKSEHAYDLAKFGLDADRIRRDYAFLYDTFGLPR